MRTLLFALALVPSLAFAADTVGENPNVGVDPGQTSTATQQAINSIDPVTGLAIDPSIPAVMVQDSAGFQTSGSSAGIEGGQPKDDQALSQQVAIGVSDRSSAALIQANPEKYVQAARENHMADDLQGSQSGMSGSDMGGMSGSDSEVMSQDQQGDVTSDASASGSASGSLDSGAAGTSGASQQGDDITSGGSASGSAGKDESVQGSSDATSGMSSDGAQAGDVTSDASASGSAGQDASSQDAGASTDAQAQPQQDVRSSSPASGY